jgi:hypothetical protein
MSIRSSSRTASGIPEFLALLESTPKGSPVNITLPPPIPVFGGDTQLICRTFKVTPSGWVRDYNLYWRGVSFGDLSVEVVHDDVFWELA